jgi:hypothetical protein
MYQTPARGAAQVGSAARVRPEGDDTPQAMNVKETVAVLQPAQFLGQPLPALVQALAHSDADALEVADQGRVMGYDTATLAFEEPVTVRPGTVLAATLDDADLPANHPDVDVPGVALEMYLGGGGQGWVYAARVQQTGCVVAVKVMRADYVAGKGKAAREALLCARVKHRNVLRVFKACPAGAFWVVIMELIQGDELHTEYLQPGQVPHCFGQLADALRALTEQQVVHCDVKPSNVLLRRAEQSPVLVDFGVAWDLRGDGEQHGISGTPYYLAPEAFAQMRPTPAWDAYALGVTAATVLGVRHDLTTMKAVREAKLSGDFDRGLVEGLRQKPHVELAAWVAELLDRDGERRLRALEAARRWGAANTKAP